MPVATASPLLTFRGQTDGGERSPLSVATASKESLDTLSAGTLSSLATSAPARSACSHPEPLDHAKLPHIPADAPAACELHPDARALSFQKDQKFKHPLRPDLLCIFTVALKLLLLL